MRGFSYLALSWICDLLCVLSVSLSSSSLQLPHLLLTFSPRQTYDNKNSSSRNHSWHETKRRITCMGPQPPWLPVSSRRGHTQLPAFLSGFTVGAVAFYWWQIFPTYLNGLLTVCRVGTCKLFWERLGIKYIRLLGPSSLDYKYYALLW